MFKFTCTAVDLQDGNPPRVLESLINTNNPLAALLVALLNQAVDISAIDSDAVSDWDSKADSFFLESLDEDSDYRALQGIRLTRCRGTPVSLELIQTPDGLVVAQGAGQPNLPLRDTFGIAQLLQSQFALVQPTILQPNQAQESCTIEEFSRAMSCEDGSMDALIDALNAVA